MYIESLSKIKPCRSVKRMIEIPANLLIVTRHAQNYRNLFVLAINVNYLRRVLKQM